MRTDIAVRMRPGAGFTRATCQSVVFIGVETAFSATRIQLSSNGRFATLIINDSEFFIPLSQEHTIAFQYGNIKIHSTTGQFLITLTNGVQVHVQAAWVQNRFSGVYVNIPSELATFTNGLLGIPGGKDFVNPDGVEMQTCAENRNNNYPTYEFGRSWKVTTPIVSSCAIDICTVDPVKFPTTLTPEEQQAIDRACAGLTGYAYETCAYDFYNIGPNGTQPSYEVDAHDKLANISFGVVVIIVDGGVQIIWDPVPGYTEYIVQYSPVGSGIWITIIVTSNPFVFPVLDGEYIIRIGIVHNGGQSPWMYSNPVRVITIDVVYPVPSGPTVIVIPTQPGWTVDPGNQCRGCYSAPNTTIGFDFGDIVNDPSSGNNSQIIIEIIVEVIEDPSTTPGTVITPGFDFEYNSGTNNTSTRVPPDHPPPTSIVVAPELSWELIWNTTTGQAGDHVSCTIIIVHTPGSTAPAFNIDIIAILGPHFILVPGSVITVYPYYTNTSYSNVQSPYIFIGGSTSLQINVTIQITFVAVITTEVRAGSHASASIELIYTSAPTGGTVTTLPSVPGNWGVFPLPSYTIVIGHTSNPETPEGGSLAIGEYFEVHVSITIPGGTTLSPQIVIVIPPSVCGCSAMTLINASIHTQPINIQAPGMVVVISPSSPTIIGNDTCTVGFDKYVNLPTGNPSDNTIVIVIVGVVLPGATNTTLGGGLAIDGNFTYSNGSQVITTPSTSITVNVTIAVLEIIQICTPVNTTVASGTKIICVIIIYAPPSTHIPAPCYNVTVWNHPSPDFVLIGGSVHPSNGTSTVGDGFIINLPVFQPAGVNLTINYTVELTNNVISGGSINIPCSYSYQTSPTSHAITSTVNTSSSISISVPVVTVVVTDMSLSPFPTTVVSVGETVTFIVTITVRPGMTPSTSIVINLSPIFIVVEVCHFSPFKI